MLTNTFRTATSISVVLAASVFFWSGPVARAQQTAPDSKNFDSRIAPLLGRRCLDCHNNSDKKGGLDLTSKAGTQAGGEGGRVLVPGKPQKSPLWQRIAENEMPPEKPLPAAEKALIKAWIGEGAKWGTDPIDRFRFSTDTRAGYDWWALQPIVRPQLPKVESSGWVRNPIDRFILSRLKQQKLQPSPPANRRTLIRRLSLDLLGLPPVSGDIDSFARDGSPDAYATLVERLLASPHFGERWARHWLDVARFGESQGFERDKLRPNAWRYRDWVVQALNADMPFDEFAQLQLAGDALWPGNPSAITATGFLVAGPYDEVGQKQQSAAMKAVVRQDELEDIVSLVGQSFLGLTVNCARCHDHKFDPVKQVEYYRLTAALAGVRHGERKIGNAAIRKQAERLAAALQSQIDSLNRQVAAIESPIRSRILAARKTNPQPIAVPPKPIARWDFNEHLNDSIGKLDGTTRGKARLESGRLHLDGRSAFVATAPLTTDMKAKTLEAWVSLDNLQQRGGGVMSLQTLDGKTFDAIVFGENEPAQWMAGSNGFTRTTSFAGPEESEADKQFVHVAVVYHADGTIAGYRNGQPYGKSYNSSGPVTFKAGQAQILFGLRHSPPGGNRLLAGAIDRAQLYDRALSADQIAASAGVSSDYIDEKELLARLSETKRDQRERLKFEISQLRLQKKRATTTTVYAVTPRQPQTAHVLRRGNPALKGEVVAAGAVGALTRVNADFQLPADAPEDRRRVKLVQWITDRQNPLFARVIVNRLWHYHFGTGIVETPNDFGFNGGRPTHPKLIDWLASELIRKNWSLKAIHRLIVNSATYRQASRFDARAAKIDARNRLLWRKSPARLEAEAVRDALLSAAGELNPAMGGPGFYDFTTYVHNTQFYFPVDPVGHSFNRRGLYRTWIRSGRNKFLDAFDCPDPSTKTPKRAVTTTPLQALALLNNSFVLRMSERFAQRLKRETGNSVERQIVHAYRIVYGRPPDTEELNLTKQFVADHKLPALCRVLFNSNEFLYVD